MKLLLVDDDESNRLTLSVLLEDEGYEVDVAASFTEAREKLVAPTAAYDGVLLDQHLGDGLGLDLLGVMRQRLPRSKAVLISGSLTELEGSTFGADAVLPKGTPFPDALAIIRRALDQLSLARRLRAVGVSPAGLAARPAARGGAAHFRSRMPDMWRPSIERLVSVTCASCVMMPTSLAGS